MRAAASGGVETDGTSSHFCVGREMLSNRRRPHGFLVCAEKDLLSGLTAPFLPTACADGRGASSVHEVSLFIARHRGYKPLPSHNRELVYLP